MQTLHISRGNSVKRSFFPRDVEDPKPRENYKKNNSQGFFFRSNLASEGREYLNDRGT